MSATRLQKYVNDVRTLPRDMMGAWRVGGASDALLELRRRTVDRAGGYAHGLVIESDLSGLVKRPPGPGIEIEPFAGPDWSSLGGLLGHRIVAQCAAAAAAGRQCIVARRNGQILGHSWVSPAVEARHESYALPLPADAIYVWQTLVTREARGLGVGSALVSFELRLARDRGYRRSWTVIHPDNHASLRTMAAVAPSQVVGRVTRLKVLSSMRSRYSAWPVAQPLEQRS